jgi:hypothetical protein
MLQFIYVDGKKLNFFLFNIMGKEDIIMIMSSLNVYWRGSRILYFGQNLSEKGCADFLMSPSAPVH